MHRAASAVDTRHDEGAGVQLICPVGRPRRGVFALARRRPHYARRRSVPMRPIDRRERSSISAIVGVTPSAADLARLIGLHPDHEIVLNGDTFNLACDAWGHDPAVSAPAMIAAHPALLAAMSIWRGSGLTFIAGNHDLAIQRPAVRTALLALLSQGATVDLRVEPWIVRRGGVHIEHGHLYDPGNSPTHPLAVPGYRAEPVGIELTRRFVGRYDAWDLYADNWAGSATDNLKAIVAFFGARTVTVTAYYCWQLAVINAETALFRPARRRSAFR